jgi:hypothetical protein
MYNLVKTDDEDDTPEKMDKDSRQTITAGTQQTLNARPLVQQSKLAQN